MDAANALASSLADRYIVERKIGEGGMAAVYLAIDLRHQRKVALKVLRPELSAVVGAERFLAEIRTTANLQHPHILPLFDSGEVDGLLYYVMPYVEGESLRDRLDRERQLAVDETVRIAVAVAEALQYAHEQGVIHRDVKPANILLSRGQPLVADFGIALAVSQAGAGRVTETGLSLGTPHYMSPEQATGERTLDSRTDVYALGCVLYEMLVGETPFGGPNARAVLTRILTEEPRSVTEARRSVPPNVEASVRRAMEKLPADRFDSADAFSRALRDPGFRHDAGLTDSALGQRAASRPGSPRATSWARSASTWLSAAALGIALVLAVTLLPGSTAPRSAPPIVAKLLPPTGQAFLTGPGFMLSPDGSTLVYVARQGDDGRAQLFVQRMDELGAVPLPGTAGSVNPFWSPDSRSVAFFSNGQLKVIEATGTGLRTLCPASDAAFGPGAWSENGTILFAFEGGLHRTDPSGSECVPVLAHTADWLAAARPSWLPDGRHFLFVAAESSRLYIGDVQTGSYQLLSAEREQGIFVAPGYVIFHHTDGGIYAQEFEAGSSTLKGEPWRIFERDAYTWAHGTYTASHTGVMVAELAPDGRPPVLAWTRGGQMIDSVPLSTRAGASPRVRIARDGRKASIDGQALAIFDFTRRVWEPPLAFSTDPRQITIEHAWSPGDSMVAVSLSMEEYTISILDRRTGSNTRLFPAKRQLPEMRPLDWSPDGRHIMYWRNDPEGQLWVVEVGGAPGTSAARELYDDIPEAYDARFSPDGRWVVYDAGESSARNVYARRFPGPGTAVRVSPDGGQVPRWRPDGRGIDYLTTDGRLVSVEVDTSGAAFEVGPPRAVMPSPPGRMIASYEPFPDGSGYAMVLLDSSPRVLTVVTDWLAYSRR